MSDVDGGNLEAPRIFAQALANQINQQDVELIVQSQKHMMSRLEKTSEMLINCNALSAVRLHVANQEFKRHTSLLTDMMKDLDSIFKRIRNLKLKLSSQYSDSFHVASSINEGEKDEKESTDRIEVFLGMENSTDAKTISAGACSKQTNSGSSCINDKLKVACRSSSCSQSSSPQSLATSPSTSDSG